MHVVVFQCNGIINIAKNNIAFPEKAVELQQFASSTEVSTLFAIHLIPARRNISLLCLLLWSLHGTSWHRSLLHPS